MTLREIAKAADVSISTVSRVINAAPGIADSTRQAVRRAMESVSYVPTRRRSASVQTSRRQRVAFFVLRPSAGLTPAYDHLLRGVSAGCNKFQLDLQVGFVDAPDQAIDQLVRGRYDGLLLHGTIAPSQRTAPLHRIPTVWLMGNSRRPSWGDQVMPDNVIVGQISAQYLHSRGHRSILCFGINSGWSLAVRAMAFQTAVEDLGAIPTMCISTPSQSGTVGSNDVDNGLRQLVHDYRSLPQRPTGLFVTEDWLLRQVYGSLREAGIQPGLDLDVISCNNDRPHLLGLTPTPATIDIQFERIAFRGVERLVGRMRGDDFDDRVRVMLEPMLVPPPPVPAAPRLAAIKPERPQR